MSSTLTEPLADTGGSTLSPLDLPIKFTLFPSLNGSVKKEITLSLRELESFLRTKSADSKEGLPLLSAGQFGDELASSGSGSYRTDANLKGFAAICVDYDQGLISPEEAALLLKDAGLAGYVYTTPSHGLHGKGNRLRVKCPCSAFLSKAAHGQMVSRLNGVFNGALDKSSFTGSQSYYIGQVRGRPRFKAIGVDGMYIDQANHLDAGSIGKAPANPTSSAQSHIIQSKTGLSIEDFRDAVMQTVEYDDYDTWVSTGMGIHFETDGSEEGLAIFDDWSAQSAKYESRAVSQRWRSFGGKDGPRVTGWTILSRARKQGWVSPDNREEWFTDEDVALFSFDDLDEDSMKLIGPATALETRGLQFLNPDQCLASPSRGHVVKGLLAPGDVGCVFGAPGTGKSLLAPYLAYGVAQGCAVFGHRTKQGKTFYVAAEDEKGMRGRVAALRIRRGQANTFRLIVGLSSLLPDSTDLVLLKSAIKFERPALIIVDTVAMAFPGIEENSSEAMSRVVSTARELAGYGAAVILIHHDTKDGGVTPRGHSVLNGALDMALHIKAKDAEGIIRGTLTKNRNGSCDIDIAFKIGLENFGTDEDGDPINFAFADELDSDSLPHGGKKLTVTQRAALKVLNSLDDNNPGGVSRAEWKKACVSTETLSSSEKKGSRDRAFNRAYKELFEGGMIAVDGDLVAPFRSRDLNDDFTDDDVKCADE